MFLNPWVPSITGSPTSGDPNVELPARALGVNARDRPKGVSHLPGGDEFSTLELTYGSSQLLIWISYGLRIDCIWIVRHYNIIYGL